MVDLINQTVGDAISDLLLVEIILAWKGLSMVDWDAMYGALLHFVPLPRLIPLFFNSGTGHARCISDIKCNDVIMSCTRYNDLPNRLCKVKIADRTVVLTTNAERTCTSPEGMQAAIDALT